MSEYDQGKILTKIMTFVQEHERVTFYRDDDTNDWYIEWFNKKGGFQCVSGPDLFTLVENLK